jgi:hypothetical protein
MRWRERGEERRRRELQLKGGLVGRKRSACLAAVAVAFALLGEALRKLWKCESEEGQSGQPMACADDHR